MSKGLLRGIVICALCALAACDRPEKLTKTNVPAFDTAQRPGNNVAVNPPGENIPETDAASWPEALPLLATQYAAQDSFQTFSGKAKVHYEGKGQSQDFNANIRIQKDQEIWLSINALGLLEVFRAVLTPDSLQAINRLDKVYYQYGISEVKNLLPAAADFQTIQSLLTGGIIGRHGQVMQVLSQDKGSSVLIQQRDFQQTLVVADSGRQLVQQTIYNPAAGLRLEAQYQQPQPLGGRLFPYTHVLQITTPDGSVRLEINYDRVVFNAPVDMPFSIPRKFKKAKLGE